MPGYWVKFCLTVVAGGHAPLPLGIEPPIAQVAPIAPSL
jgi:hypothetical protein